MKKKIKLYIKDKLKSYKAYKNDRFYEYNDFFFVRLGRPYALPINLCRKNPNFP